MKNNIPIITGITASGKSKLCARLVESCNNIRIINCDSKQIYKEIPIITDQPEKQTEFYRLYGYVSVRENYSVGLWLNDLRDEITRVIQNNQIPIITGGSGLYINSLIKGLSTLPQISQKVREHVNSLSKNLNKDEFYKLVLSYDSEIQNRIYLNDTHRLSRALEVILETGKSIFLWRENKNFPLIKSSRVYVILPDREYVYRKINLRFIKMVKNGVLDEVKNLLNMNLNSDLPAMKAHGVPEIIKFLNNEITLTEATGIAQANTRHYAKRQYTWFKNQFSDTEVIERIDDTFCSKIIQQLNLKY